MKKLVTFGMRNFKGQTLSIEVAITAVLMVVFVALAIDIFIVVYGFNSLDSAARDAARAASGTNDPLNGYIAAQQAAKSHATDGVIVTQPAVTGAAPTAGMNSPPNPPGNNFTANPDFQYIVNPGNPGDPTNPQGAPYVTVTTRCAIKAPIPINLFGAKFDPSGAFNYGRTYTFPILGVQFSPSQTTATANTAGPSPQQTAATNSNTTSTNNTATTSQNAASTTQAAANAANTANTAANTANASTANTTANTPANTAAASSAATAAAANTAATAATAASTRATPANQATTANAASTSANAATTNAANTAATRAANTANTAANATTNAARAATTAAANQATQSAAAANSAATTAQAAANAASTSG